MVEPEEDRQEEAKRKGEEYVANGEVPRVDEPTSIFRRVERFRYRKAHDIDICIVSREVGEASEEDDCQRCTIVLDEFANVSVK